MSIIQISELLLKNTDEEISLVIEKEKQKIYLFEDTMHIWRHGH